MKIDAEGEEFNIVEEYVGNKCLPNAVCLEAHGRSGSLAMVAVGDERRRRRRGAEQLAALLQRQP